MSDDGNTNRFYALFVSATAPNALFIYQRSGAPGIDKKDFELFSMAVSAINGCGMCMHAHEDELRKAGMTTEQIQASVRIAAVVNGVARTLAAETAAA